MDRLKAKAPVLYVEGMNECQWSQTVKKRVDRYENCDRSCKDRIRERVETYIYSRYPYKGDQVQGKILVVSTVSCNKSPYAIPTKA